MRVLIVDDSAFMRRMLTDIIESEPGFKVVDTACDGVEALAKAESLRPDIITMDIEMPKMDGLTALRRLRRSSRVPVIVLSSLTTRGSRAAIRALHLGAQDVLTKEASQFSLSAGGIKTELIAKIKALRHHNTKTPAPKSRSAGAAPEPKVSPETRVVCIGSSTGGPPVLESILAALPASFPLPIVIAQHMPRMFTESLSQRLNDKCALRVDHAESDRSLKPGHAYLIPGGQQGQINAGFGPPQLRIADDPPHQLYKPSVDVLFQSAAKLGRAALGVVLTGMGQDGKEGGRRLQDSGGLILAQNEETCVVYGMPKAVTEAGIASASLSPEEIGKTLATCQVKLQRN